MRAQKIQKKAAHVDFDWSDEADVIAKVDEELTETKEAIDARQPRATSPKRSAICSSRS